MAGDDRIQSHYTHGDLIGAISQGLERLGKTSAEATIDDLGPVDEFHIGGRQATLDFTEQLGITEDTRCLDIGCGIGGPARVIADKFGCEVTGIDLTAEYIDVANALSDWVGLAGQLSFDQGSALDLPYENEVFDTAYMLHVGMNIEKKERLAEEVTRTLKPGGTFGIYDVMLTGDAALTFPVPWATLAETSFVATPVTYRSALEAAGFDIVSERNRREFALDFFQQLKARTQAAGGPPPLGLHLVMGQEAPTKIANMISNIEAGRIAPVEIVAKRR